MKKGSKLVKKGLSLLMVLMIVLSAIPITAFAEASQVTVYVTISEKGIFQKDKNNLTMIRRPISIEKGKSIFDALAAAHEIYYQDGEGGYATTAGTKYFSKFWGVSTYNIGYFSNGGMVSDPEAPVCAGDDIEGTIYEDYSKDIYARFDRKNTAVAVGEELSLTLLSNILTNSDWSGGMMNGGLASEPMEGAKILLGDSDSGNIEFAEKEGCTTDSEGKVSLSFESPGCYYISAEKDGATMIPPICKVTVTEPRSNEEKAQIVSGDKAALTFECIRKDNRSVSEVTSRLKLPLEGESGCTVISWSSDDESVIRRDGTVIPPEGENKTVNLEARIAYGEVYDRLIFELTVLGSRDKTENEEEAEVIMKNIASSYAAKDTSWWRDSSKWWAAVGMNAYEKNIPDTDSKVKAEAKQAFVNKNISDITVLSESASAHGDKLAKSINGMSSFGYDPTAMWTVNRTKLDAVSQLKQIKLEDAKQGWYSTVAPYVLIALGQGEFNSDALEEQYIDYLISELKNLDWSWGVDVPAMILHGLAPYYSRAEVKTEIDKTILEFSKFQGNDGSYGNANSDACVIIALAQLGINPYTDSRFIKNGNCLIDGLLRYSTSEKDGFWFGTAGSPNNLATQQGFLALIAASQVVKTNQNYNIYDFSASAKTPVYADGNGSEESTPAEPVGEKDITVKLTLKADSGTWIPKTAVTLKSGATVYHAFTKVLDEKGYRYTGASKGYVKSVTNPSGVTLSEFDKGKNSGWLYKVNSTVPNVGLTEYTLADGDNILWYYTSDWTKDPDAVAAAGGSIAVEALIEQTKENAVGKTEVTAVTDSNGKAVAAVDSKEIDKVLEALTKSAKDNNSAKEVQIIVKTDKEAGEVVTKLNKSSLIQLKEKVDIVRIQTPAAEICLNKKILEQISESLKGDVEFSIKKVNLFNRNSLPEEQKNQIQEKIGGRTVLDFSLVSGGTNFTNFNDKIQITVPYSAEAGEDINSLIIYYIDENGTMKLIKDSCYNPQEKTMNFEVQHFSHYAIGYNPVLFNDTLKHWAKEQIVYLAARDVVKGINNEKFAPNNNVTRAEFVQILANLSGADLSKYNGCSFNDVNKQAWFAKSAAWAQETGLVTGTLRKDGRVYFNPNDCITRQDMSVLLSRFMSKIEEKKLEDVNKTIKFSDQDQIAGYALSAVCELQKAGIINGKTNNNFAPKESATRAECSKMISVLMQDYF